jgi:PST family polysaccharide transporter
MDAAWLKYLPLFLRTKIIGRHSLQAILSNSGWLFADKILRLGVGLFVGVWLARYLGPEQFGQFNYALAFVSLFSAIATLGLDGIVVRELVRHPERIDEILGSTIVLKISGGCLAFIMALSVTWLVRPEDTLTLSLVGIIALGMVFQAFDVVDFWFQSQVQAKFSVYAKNFAFLLISGVKIWLIVHHAGLISFAWAGLVEIIVGAGGLVFAFRTAGNMFASLNVRWPVVHKLLNESWPLLLSGLAVMLYMRLDIVMLREMAGDREAGIYAAATRLSEIWYFLPMVIVSSSFPVIIKSRDSTPGLYLSRLRKLYFFMIWLAVGVSLPLSFFSGLLVSILFGEGFKEAGPVFAIQLWASVAVFLGVASSQYLLAEQLQKISFYRTLIGLLCNAAINLVLIPKFGATGAAIATVVSYFIATFSLVLFRSTRAHAVCLLMAPLTRN